MPRRSMLELWLAAAGALAVMSPPVRAEIVAPGTDFTKYKSYAWSELQHRTGPNRVANEEVVDEVDELLAEHAYTDTDTGNGDLVILVAPGSDGRLWMVAYDAKSQKAVWRSRSRDPVALSNSSPVPIERAVQQLMAGFPLGGGAFSDASPY